jgi:lysozyme
MKASEKCLELIRRFEGFSAKPYKCPAGVWTIGYGSTRYADGRAVSGSDKHVTPAEADALMIATLGAYEQAVHDCITVDLAQHEFDALVDFAYNAGAGSLRSSTLARKLNSGDRAGAAAEFGRWVNGGGKVLPGLVKRRAAERALFLGEAG